MPGTQDSNRGRKGKLRATPRAAAWEASSDGYASPHLRTSAKASPLPLPATTALSSAPVCAPPEQKAGGFTQLNA
jgi:hypothetical protein